MKICLIAHANSIHTQLWAKFLAKKGHEVHLVSFYPDKIEGVQVYNIKSNLANSDLKYLFNILSIRRLVRRLKPDLLNGYYVISNGMLASFTGISPLVISAAGTDVLIDPKKSLIKKVIVKRILKKADLVTSVAEHMTITLIKLGVPRKKILTLVRGIDLDIFNNNVKKNCQNTQKNKIILSTRNFKDYSNIHLLIKSIPHILEKEKNIKVIFLGAGPTKKDNMKLAKNLNVSQFVRFENPRSHMDVPKYLGISDVYISTYLTDGTSVSLLEAMACGVFPIVSDIPANREWIKHGENGFLIPGNSSKLLATGILEALRNKPLREKAKEKNWELVNSKANFNKNMQILENHYLSLLKK